MPSSIEPHGGWHMVLALCSGLHCGGWGVGRGRPRACGVCRAHSTLACGCVASCRPGTIAWEVHGRRICRPTVDKRCALCSMAGVYKFIMPSSGIRNRVRVRGFFHKSVRLPDFENRNNTKDNSCSRFCFPLKFLVREKDWRVGQPGKVSQKHAKGRKCNEPLLSTERYGRENVLSLPDDCLSAQRREGKNATAKMTLKLEDYI